MRRRELIEPVRREGGNDGNRADKVYLTDLARDVGGYPIDIEAVAELLERADRCLPGGRDCKEPLTKDQIATLTEE